MVIRDIQLGNRKVGLSQPPLIVAEMSGNHNQSLDSALEIVDAAAHAGVDALKIQTYTAETMTLNVRDREFMIVHPENPWRGNSLYELYEKAHTPWEWHQAIFERCHARGMIAFSTPFDATAIDFLETLDVPLYKIASAENTDLPLIRRVAATGKPLIISTGMANEEELNEMVAAAREGGCQDLILLKCTCGYPAPPEEANLRTIPDLRRRFQCHVGISDHTLGIGVSIASIALGAVMIEKHFTLTRRSEGVDSFFSLEPNEMKALVTESRHAWQALGDISYGPTAMEKSSLRYRRSLYVAQDMKAGDLFTDENLKVIRPGYGLPPKHYEHLLGKPVQRDVKKGAPVSWSLVEER